ncbi:MAG: cryptochrome/photolyase family protein, partial [Bacteroidota bacterium]
MKTLRLILGDQLNSLHSWFDSVDPDVVYVMMEIKPETEYVLHHGQKILAIFSSMRNFSKKIKQQGHHVHYIHFDDEENTHSFENNILWLIEKYQIERFEYQEPDEYRLDKQLNDFIRTLSIETKLFSSEHFYTQRNDLKSFFAGKKSWLMETFYRDMRRKNHILMEEGKPAGGNWNFDKSNRNKLPSKHIPPEPKSFGKPHSKVKQYLLDKKINYFGEIDEACFTWPLSRSESVDLL